MKGRNILLALPAAAALLLSGCAMLSVEELYAVPRRSEEYSQLESAIDSAMIGLDYSAPISGDNQQPVQMADLDGDGVDEYLVFAAGDLEKPLQILIFSQGSDGACTLTDVIESNGSAFEQVEYINFDEKPGCELVVGRQVSDQVLRSVSVYTFSGGSAEQLLVVGYSKFLTSDLDSDGRSEVMVFRPGEAESGRGTAVLYSVSGGQITRSVETELSVSPSRIRRIMPGKLQGGAPAVYVASTTEEDSIVTDIFAIAEGRFTNIAFFCGSETTIETLGNFYVYAEDIDEDGIMELPAMIPMKQVSGGQEEEPSYLLRWFSVDALGNKTEKLHTFHNYLGGWYVQLRQTWSNRVSVAQGGNTYTFYVWDHEYLEAEPLFTIYVFTGSSRDEDAVQQGRFALYRAEGVAYAAKLEPDAAAYGLTEEELTDSFRLIRQDWRTGES